MHKYLYTIKIAIEDLAAYPSRFFSSLSVDGFSLIIYFFLWRTLFSGGGVQSGQLNLNEVITYYAVAFTIRKLTFSKNISRTIRSDVHKGTLSNYLIRPISYSIYQYVRILSGTIVTTVVPLGFLIFVTVFFPNYFLRPDNVFLFSITLYLATLIAHLTFSILGAAAFWTVQTWGIISMVGRFTTLLAGGVIPLTYFPTWLQNINNYLPFKHTVSTPILVYLGKQDSTTNLILIQVAWVLLLLVIYKIVWKKALRKYDSVGK